MSTKPRRCAVEVDSELARSVDSKPESQAEPSHVMTADKATSGEPEALYPHLYVLLRLRRMAFAEGYTREETQKILGISKKTLKRWIDQGLLEDYRLPDVCASAAGIERCLITRRAGSRKHY
jgi:DNA-directed RNA polymerase specialized sigma24 family protein